MNTFFIALMISMMSGSGHTTVLTPGHVTLEQLAQSHGLAGPKKAKDTYTITGKNTRIRFQADSRQITFNNSLIWLNAPITVQGKKPRLSRTDVNTIITPLLRTEDHLPRKAPAIVIIDPGHGGKSTGAKGSRKHNEKDLVLEIAKQAALKLGKHGVKALLTRDSDKYMSLEERARKTASLKAGLFVSIHMNHAANRNAEGIETFTTTPVGMSSSSLSKPDNTVYRNNKHDAANSILALNIQRNTLKSTSAPDRGIKHARFTVIREAPCPAVLIECGFLSNKKEESQLIQKAYRERIAEGITQGILEYIKQCSS